MKIWIIMGAILMAFAIVLDAFGAHIIKSKISLENLKIFEISKTCDSSDKLP